jgi:hypothetical protein
LSGELVDPERFSAGNRWRGCYRAFERRNLLKSGKTIMESEQQQVTDRVRELYEEIGWKESGGVTYDAETGEDLRPSAQDYIAATRRRALRHLPAQGEKLIDMASGPIQYP